MKRKQPYWGPRSRFGMVPEQPSKLRSPGYTPGPWEINPNKGGHILAANGDGIAEVFSTGDGVGSANLVLIAAAPELLEALERLLARATQSLNPATESTLWAAQAAIAKAKEESQ